jgi:protein arginine kinase
MTDASGEVPGRVTDAGLDWLDASGAHADVVLSTRIRLARNIQGHAFGRRARVADRREVLRLVKEGVGRVVPLLGAEVREMATMPPRSNRILLERRIASRELLASPDGVGGKECAVVLPPASPLSVMVNEEDHLRLQVLVSGLDLKEAWNRVDLLDDELGQHLPYAFHPEFGFLTSCPTNVGTGLRASVLLHLPGLVLMKEIGKVLQGLSQMGLTYRGLHGEGSEVVGNFFQISNQTTLGKSEEDLVDHLDQVVREVIRHEMKAREILLRDAAGVTEDKVWRAYGLLRYARSLSFEELMNLLSGVRLGASLKLLPGLRVYPLNRIMIFAQPAHLEEAAGRVLSPVEEEVHRAAYVRRILERDGAIPPDAPGTFPEAPPTAPAA